MKLLIIEGLEAVKRHGRARLGDRTLIDALQPALEVLRAGIESRSSKKKS